MVDALGILGDESATEFAYYFEHALVVVHGVVEVEWCVVKLLGVGKVALFEFNDFAHQRVCEVMAQIGVVCIKVSHGLFGVLFVVLDEFGQYIFDVAGDYIVGDSVDGRVGVVVD